jgi:phage baseplate assembly protein W
MSDTIQSFLGTGWGFPPQFSKASRDVKMISDEADIKSSLEILLATRIGERIMQPAYGCNLDEMVFEPLNVSLQTYIKDLVFTSIYFYEPRINPENVTLEPVDVEGIVNVIVEYTIRATNTRHNLVFPYYLEEGNNI